MVLEFFTESDLRPERRKSATTLCFPLNQLLTLHTTLPGQRFETNKQYRPGKRTFPLHRIVIKLVLAGQKRSQGGKPGGWNHATEQHPPPHYIVRGIYSRHRFTGSLPFEGRKMRSEGYVGFSDETEGVR